MLQRIKSPGIRLEIEKLLATRVSTGTGKYRGTQLWDRWTKVTVTENKETSFLVPKRTNWGSSKRIRPSISEIRVSDYLGTRSLTLLDLHTALSYIPTQDGRLRRSNLGKMAEPPSPLITAYARQVKMKQPGCTTKELQWAVRIWKWIKCQRSKKT